MLDWLLDMLPAVDDSFSDTRESNSPVSPCPYASVPTVEVLALDEVHFQQRVELQAFGRPWAGNGTYAWSVVSGTCTLSSKAGARITATRALPGTVRLQVTYSIGAQTSPPAFHTLRFVDPVVYVIGGGAAGLKASAHLLERGYRVVLCEATGALGGRARTRDALGGDFKVDLGCQWLHGDEWRWELEEKTSIDSLGFKEDNQQGVYPQLTGMWAFPRDVQDVINQATRQVEEALEHHSSAAASTVLPINAEVATRPAYQAIFTKRRNTWVTEQVRQHLGDRAAASVSAEAIQQRAVELARKMALVVRPPEINNRAAQLARDENPGVEPTREAIEAKKVTAKEMLLNEKANAFDQGLGNESLAVLEAVQQKQETARTQLANEEYERLKPSEPQVTLELTPQLQGRFNAQHPPERFAALCQKAYEMERAKEGPLEEAAEYEAFSNIDRSGVGLGEAEEEGCDVEQSNDNSWYLGGYGGLLVAYGAYLQGGHPKRARLTVRLNATVTRIAFGAGEPQVTINGAVEKASAVVLTVSTGVINSGDIALEGTGAAAVLEAYGKLPMGNYKKVVLVFDQEVLLARASDEDIEAHQQPSTVYWYQDGDGRLWKFIVPDGFRRVVITIVGGALADALDADADLAEARARAAMQAVGLVAAQAVVQERFVSTWKTEPTFRGAYSYTAPGGEGMRKRLIDQPLRAHRVALAGEALYSKYGTAHGAYITGLRAAKVIDKALSHLLPVPAENLS